MGYLVYFGMLLFFLVAYFKLSKEIQKEGGNPVDFFLKNPPVIVYTLMIIIAFLQIFTLVQSASITGDSVVILVNFVLFSMVSAAEATFAIYGHTHLGHAYTTLFEEIKYKSLLTRKKDDNSPMKWVDYKAAFRDLIKMLISMAKGTVLTTFSVLLTYWMVIARLSTIPVGKTYSTASIEVDFASLPLIDYLPALSSNVGNTIINIQAQDMAGVLAIVMTQLFSLSLLLVPKKK